jgi:hypothetical protein
MRDMAEGDIDTAQDTLWLLTNSPRNYGVSPTDPRVAEALLRQAALLAMRAGKVLRKTREKKLATDLLDQVGAVAEAATRAADLVPKME